MIAKSKNYYIKGNVSKLLFFIAVYIFCINSITAQGDLLIFPKRIVFDGKKKVEQIMLSNIGKDSAVFNISFIEYKMTEVGAFNTITEPVPGQWFASPYLRFFPRQVILAPNETQTVKVQMTNPNKLEDGEYRSHLYFRAEKINKPLGQVAKKLLDTTSVSVKLEAVFGLAIPTIINKGRSNTTTSISDLNYTNENNIDHFISFNINRSGNMSVYGDINVYYISKDKSLPYEVAKVMGIAVYAPGTIRKIKILLPKPEGVTFKGGKFKVVYTKNESKEVIATAEK